MKKLQIIFLLFSSLTVCSQAKFEEGYIVNAQNTKIECLIKNLDWGHAPSKLEYKLSEHSDTVTTQANEINAFQIYNSSQYYKKVTVSIDRNSKSKEFLPMKEQLFLKVLVEGDASLYVTNGDVFFYQKDNGELKQLVFKEYYNKDRNLERAYTFRTELYEALKCKKDDAITFRKVDYNRKQLVNLLVSYNQCVKANYVNYAKNRTKWEFDVSVLTGVYLNRFESNVNVIASTEYISKRSLLRSSSSSSNMAFGIQLEAFLPFKNRKWAIVFSPNYQIMDGRSSERFDDAVNYETYIPDMPSRRGGNIVVPGYLDVEINSQSKYSLLEIPVGMRHYLNLNEVSKLFLEGSVCLLTYVQTPTETVTIKNLEQNEVAVGIFSPERTTSSIFKLGAGYSFKKYSLALNYHPNRQISNNKGNSISILASYKVF